MKLEIRLVLALLAGLALLSGFTKTPSKSSGKQYLNASGHRPPGYTEVVTSAPGKTIYISGRGGAGADGKLPPDFETQAKNTFQDLKRCLSSAGATFNDVVKINYYVTDLASTQKLRAIRAQYLNMDQPPAATLVQVGLGGGALVEIEATAVVPQ